MVGTSGKMQDIYKVVERVADSRATVLIRGESGTGKELIARALHFNSMRATKPFVAVSCAALPETLLESELFGYEKNAFTGAVAAKPGRFEMANQGTLFLDEIGDIPPPIQIKLLRVLQEWEFERIGGTKTLKVDVRLVARRTKTWKKPSLRRSSARLYYRLNIVSGVSAGAARASRRHSAAGRSLPGALYQAERAQDQADSPASAGDAASLRLAWQRA